MKFILASIILFFAPTAVLASADLSIDPQDIRFSTDTLTAGDEIRIYAKVYNIGDQDVSGYVSFYQGSTLIDDSLVISLPANGSPEEVYIDFVVPERTFNILALIRGTDPADTNQSNDSALTPMFTPVVDDDRDGIANSQDNCPAAPNPSQTDSDADGSGDDCDQDDDNDGLSDDVEAELGSDATLADSDGDGVQDADDAYPADADKAVQKQPATQAQEAAEAFQQVVEEVARRVQENITAEATVDEVSQTGEPQEATGQPNSFPEVQISPNAVFSYTQDGWNAFSFVVLGNIGVGAVYVWDFGDGVTSSKASVQHVYTSSGAFPVTLSVTDGTGIVSMETTTVFVPFFHLKNRFVLAALILLVMLLVSGTWAFFRFGRDAK